MVKFSFTMFNGNRNLFIIALIAVVNALGYGIIIPILYSYSLRFGLSDFQNGLLFATFSVFQFLSTPLIGRLSDKYGRKPLLLISIAGTALSFFMMALAPSAVFLFLARALDGITAGNIPVASAVIADTTTQKERTKGFGIIGASFGFGLIFGPAISALTVGISPSLPFIIAGSVAAVAVILTSIFLPETNKYIGEVAHSKLFDFKKIFQTLSDKNIGPTLLITFFYFLAISMFIYAFQPFSIKLLNMSAHQIALIFTIFGIFGLLSQLLFVSRFTSILGLKKAYSTTFIIVTFTFFTMFFVNSLTFFIVITVVSGVFQSIVNPLTQTILSKETDEKSQGSIMGINASYMSIGQILGPILGGIIASVSLRLPFVAGSFFIFICFLLSFKVLKLGVKKESAF